MSAAEFTWRTRVYWEDTDGGGVVYYANYLKFMERARTEWLRSLGHSQQEIAEQFGFVFAVAEARVNYRKPARLDDELVVSCVPVPEGRASIRFRQLITRAGAPIADGEVRVVCVDAKSFRPRALPDFIQAGSNKE
ncbi:MAG TPA: tol-pal system-associated acyl-CoA thioesterase [Steroidobacteraceae bacterium]|jgi:acyl-CoA thioester hydrolase|nr:tol-pal system-associated acyl-CoA thioesterase [Steroidobacteraceae bacterium]